ncbi:MAG: 4'-phosphopantetheinyl transferase superfamily protein [Bacteroidales bacterium]|nr:4'-phosphopantetheinyl transferase superfamily protein [Bacteroidales bacterium]
MANFKELLLKSTEDFPLLSPGELHVWNVFSKSSPARLVEYRNTLSEKELTKVHLFEFQQTRDSYIISQGALRMLLSGYLGIPPKSVKIGRRRKGKPYSIDDQGLYFNISNSGKLVTIAFSRDSELGIDVEQIRTLPDLDEMIIRNFTSREISFINGKSEERTTRFFRFWTIKESYLKAIGEGMRLTPDNLEFAIEKDGIRQLSVNGIFEQEDWNFKEFSIFPDYVGTLTYGRDNTVIKQLDFT